MRNKRKKIVVTREQKIAAIQKFTLFSDVFSRVVFEDVAACQYVLRILTGDYGLQLRWVKTQFVLSKINSHDAWLDVLAESMDGKVYAMEIQNRDDVDHPHRVRFYGAMIDSYLLEKGKPYHALPDVVLLYVCREDFLDGGVTSWCVEKRQRAKRVHSKKLGVNGKGGRNNNTKEKRYEDGLHIQYVNAELDDGSETARLMRYFLTADPKDMSHGELSKRVRFLKCTEKGWDRMCEVTDLFWRSGYMIGKERGKRRGKRIGRNEGIQMTRQAQSLFGAGKSKQEIARALQISEKEVALMVE